MSIKIAKRLKSDWTDYQENKSVSNCDDCGARLWVAPDGKSLYCNAIHEVNPFSIVTHINGKAIKE